MMNVLALGSLKLHNRDAGKKHDIHTLKANAKQNNPPLRVGISLVVAQILFFGDDILWGGMRSNTSRKQINELQHVRMDLSLPCCYIVDCSCCRRRTEKYGTFLIHLPPNAAFIVSRLAGWWTKT
eukprot:3172347-Amphidinium_carterae.1